MRHHLSAECVGRVPFSPAAMLGVMFVLKCRLDHQFPAFYSDWIAEAVLTERFDVQSHCVGLCLFHVGDYIGGALGN